MESRQKFSRRSIGSFFPMFPRNLRHLRSVIQGVIQHGPHRHRIMNIGLGLYPINHIYGLLTSSNHASFQNITIFLYGNRQGSFLLHVIFLRILSSCTFSKGQDQFTGIQFLQIPRLYLLPSVKKIKINRVRKDLVL